jgi:S-adenosylmethionine synthetase
MFEKVNPMHPDKIADRIAGALVDYAYTKQEAPKIAVEVLIGHGTCHIIAETSVNIPLGFISKAVERIAREDVKVDYLEVPQDAHLAANQDGRVRCGDNGIFKGVPTSAIEYRLTHFARSLYKEYTTDGKFILREVGEWPEPEYEFIICQSCGDDKLNEAVTMRAGKAKCIINPLGDWTGGVNVDSGATNRKLGSDMGRAVTGGGLHGKDLSKADVSVNIYAFLRAKELGRPVELSCAIGDEVICGKPYSEIVRIAKEYIDDLGGFEKLAEWGLI